MSKDPAQARLTRRYVEKREAILDAAARRFNHQGVRGTTLSDVAEDVGLSTNSITYYYRKKEDLVVACLLRAIGEMVDIASAAQQQPAPRERVKAFIALFFERLARTATGERPELMSFREIRALPDSHADIAFDAYTDMFRRIRQLLRERPPADPAQRSALSARAHLLLSLATGAMSWVERYEPEDYPKVAQTVVDVLLHGIAAPSARWHAQMDVSALLPAPDRPETTQEAFLRAATELLNEQGYRGASADRISARLNLTKGAFYHHNENKDDLISACVDRMFAVIRNTQTLVENGPGTGWDKLCAVSRALVQYQFSSQGPLLRLTIYGALPEDMRKEKMLTMSRLSARIVRFLVLGMQDGSIRALDQSIAALQVNGMINAAVELSRWVRDAHADNAADLFVRPLLMGILSEP
ncbi:Transcriptional regulator, TetR/AcrR-family [Cupriavidus necator]|uniref:TetR/AcrR family transcriptional regulator n=1 Tax=Cupriavidus necator (strain ATCC 17699 / DSM 428 / KCTC 22496 / NCIMB 10442 / H16 / Stanier 337) TaxID=381666 RepID=Q0K3B2_CUPNH|nr:MULTISPECIES: TetR/AcrR family transcriptional regulator [Cupriavidus]EON19090.1 TetR/AcrR family transcriptional regulator [Cupriavidus sp. GA3-3]KUE87503.1 TetR family transcriptional regulator [Cupriavidus necator]QCC03416.1 TetR/AcrR family transcriptional regulator [Cupriavidus necator H16]QQB80472.1 TetR/AcrR family transcriptional regulator [Cupriavidus necator]WKA44752.1 TetR/AcrR family transcriptional regulator [Cupriavidus necator]